jgi:quercetin dioxygenase-like cupin family protein
MQITRSSLETVAGPAEWFSGTVYFDTLATPSPVSRLSAVNVHFSPGARTAWHTHPNGQAIYVTEGVGLCQRRGGPVEVLRPGDSVFFEPGEDHWHGATPDRFMVHLAMLEVDEAGNSAAWGDHVSDEEYHAAPDAVEGSRR